MAASAAKDDGEMITAINVTPLVDVVLVLLIILMVTASYVASQAIPMDLPSGGPPDAAPRTLAITIDPTGALFLDAAPIREDGLRTRVRTYVGEVGETDARATIAADALVSHGEVVRIIDLLRRERVTHFAINVQPEAAR